MNNDEQLRYPIGKFSPRETYTGEELASAIRRIESFPSRLEALVNSLSAKQLEYEYRPGGWKGRQVIHHLSDSHMNAYIRFKWTLTEETPLIKAYDEKAWAETADASFDPAISLAVLRAIHPKLAALMKSLRPVHLERSFIHPETKKNVRLDRMIDLYAWHGDHHLGHLQIISRKSDR